MMDPREERELEAYLAGDTPVSKRYAEASRDEPPAELDEKILAAAEEDLKVVELRRQWRRRGAIVGIAATVVLAVSIVLQLTLLSGGPGDEALLPEAEDFQAQPGESGAMRDQAFSVREQKREANVLDAPQAVKSLSPAPALRPELAAPARGSPDAVAAAVQVIRAYQAGGAADAPAEKRQAGTAEPGRSGVEEIIVSTMRRESVIEESEGVASSAPAPQTPVDPAERKLAEILQRFEAGDTGAAAALLEEFRIAYPDHPVTQQLNESD